MSSESNAVGRRVVYAEMLGWEELVRPDTIALAKRHGLDVFAAVRPWDLARWGEARSRWSGEGARLHAWPMLSDEEGRWCSRFTLRSYLSLARRVIAATPPPVRDGLAILVDLEPPIAAARRFLAERGAAKLVAFGAAGRAALRALVAGPQKTALAERALGRFVAESRAAGMRVEAAVVPLVLGDGGPGGPAQRALFTPVHGPAWDAVHVMLYTTLLEGYSGGLIGRRTSLELLRRGSALARRRFGPRAVVALGAVGLGAFGDEAVYPSPAELARDVEVAREGGDVDLGLFELRGVLGRGDPDRWLAPYAAR